eukprot:gene4259-8477_t
MVFAGQDAWRRHPLLDGCWKNPFPGLRTAIGIFAVYVIVEGVYNYVSAPPIMHRKPSIKYSPANEFGDQMPNSKSKGGHH